MRQTWRLSAAKGRSSFAPPSAQTFAPVTGAALEVGDGVNGDMIGFLDVEDRVGEGLAEVPPQRFGHDAEQAPGDAHVGNQPVDFILEPAGEGVAFLAVIRERLGKVFLRARFKKPGFHRPMSWRIRAMTSSPGRNCERPLSTAARRSSAS